jgi:hypothetical protein
MRYTAQEALVNDHHDSGERKRWHGGRRRRETDTTVATERPLMVSLLPMVLALLILLVLVLCVRIWVTSRLVETAARAATRAPVTPAPPVPGPRSTARVVTPPPPPPAGAVRVVERRSLVLIRTSPPEVPTFVYANGGALLGRAPLRTAALQPGYHRLLFWAPSIGGRASRLVYVRPDATTWVRAEVRPSRQF